MGTITIPEPEAYTHDETYDEQNNSGSAFEVIDDDSDIIAELSDSYQELIQKVKKLVKLFTNKE